MAGVEAPPSPHWRLVGGLADLNIAASPPTKLKKGAGLVAAPLEVLLNRDRFSATGCSTNWRYLRERPPKPDRWHFRFPVPQWHGQRISLVVTSIEIGEHLVQQQGAARNATMGDCDPATGREPPAVSMSDTETSSNAAIPASLERLTALSAAAAAAGRNGRRIGQQRTGQLAALEARLQSGCGAAPSYWRRTSPPSTGRTTPPSMPNHCRYQRRIYFHNR